MDQGPPPVLNRQCRPSHGVKVTDPRRRPEQSAESNAGRVPDPTADRVEEHMLLDRARQGDTAAYAELVRRNQDLIYGLAVRLLGDETLAEELAQDAFVKAHRALGSFRGDARFSTWVYRIAINLCRDHFESPAARFRQRQTSLDGPGLERFDPPADGARPDEALEAEEVARDFAIALNELDGMYKEAFLLRHQEGLPYDEISDVLEISVSNAKVRVHRARELILAVLRERGYDV